MGPCAQLPERLCRYGAWLGLAAFSLALGVCAGGQTASTGALAGVALDPSGATLPGVTIHLVGEDANTTRSATSDNEGRFTFLLLPPGEYQLQADKRDFEPLDLSGLQIAVTETLRVEIHLRLPKHYERAQVSADTVMVQTDISALGRVVNETAINGLPLVARNFAQIVSLSPGVTTGVSNAGELGLGATAQSQIGKSNDGIYVHGARSYDNNWQLDGISVSDVQSTGSTSGGIPIPNPDTLEEFKVQTALYDAAFGRAVGANVTIITKKGSNKYHGTAFEFVRNNVFNANDFFLNKTGRPRPDLKQNQFGFALGGPIKRDRLLFFGSYQGTRQINGLAAGQTRIACSASLSEPPLTNNRSAAALGKLFGGMKGALGGALS